LTKWRKYADNRGASEGLRETEQRSLSSPGVLDALKGRQRTMDDLTRQALARLYNGLCQAMAREPDLGPFDPDDLLVDVVRRLGQLRGAAPLGPDDQHRLIGLQRTCNDLDRHVQNALDRTTHLIDAKIELERKCSELDECLNADDVRIQDIKATLQVLDAADSEIKDRLLATEERANEALNRVAIVEKRTKPRP